MIEVVSNSFYTEEPCMNPDLLLERKKNILEHLSMLPRKILSLHGHDNLTDLVLHELCNERCFNIDKAAYFIDNPDFDCLRGAAGHCRADFSEHDGDIWQSPDYFVGYSQKSPFNQKVRSCMHDSSFRHKKDERETVACIAQELDLSRHGFYSWPLKNDNHGIFIYERAQDSDFEGHDDFLPEGVVLLSFCPVNVSLIP